MKWNDKLDAETALRLITQLTTGEYETTRPLTVLDAIQNPAWSSDPESSLGFRTMDVVCDLVTNAESIEDFLTIVYGVVGFTDEDSLEEVGADVSVARASYKELVGEDNVTSVSNNCVDEEGRAGMTDPITCMVLRGLSKNTRIDYRSRVDLARWLLDLYLVASEPLVGNARVFSDAFDYLAKIMTVEDIVAATENPESLLPVTYGMNKEAVEARVLELLNRAVFYKDMIPFVERLALIDRLAKLREAYVSSSNSSAHDIRAHYARNVASGYNRPRDTPEDIELWMQYHNTTN